MSKRIADFIAMYQRLDKDNLALLDEIYHQDIHFIDPLHEVHGRDQLHLYFANLYANIKDCSFTIIESFECEDRAFLYWTMAFCHPRINGGREVLVNGHSLLRFVDGQVIMHRDYFDVGQLLYRNLPVLGGLIKFIEKRASGV
ncbi:nuclear transport factor 2 family protein [Pseudoalteromonas sp. T1lg48]|uniref:nuclear transport factor 2 family protein n=1 Tax=Pseudoalteromonas sp. T1lg48 TaxID=2077100 RepID=UPI000CF73393|nr:nuclear transport factor 2 family protein [Pseudoalteromonas sp. T1lg48]